MNLLWDRMHQQKYQVWMISHKETYFYPAYEMASLLLEVPEYRAACEEYLTKEAYTSKDLVLRMHAAFVFLDRRIWSQDRFAAFLIPMMQDLNCHKNVELHGYPFYFPVLVAKMMSGLPKYKGKAISSLRGWLEYGDPTIALGAANILGSIDGYELEAVGILNRMKQNESFSQYKETINDVISCIGERISRSIQTSRHRKSHS